MESDGENLENIFEEYEDTENARESERAENIQNTEESSGVKIPVARRIIKNPRLKFNAERLCGERGIPVLVEHFKNVKFKGVGHEKEDLDKLLTKLEHWTHRLFPSMKFEECLHQIEKLGKKRPVQTCLRKMRLNMPILSSDFVNENEDDVQRVEDSEPVEEVDAFDRLVGSQDTLNPDYSATENVSDLNCVHSSPLQTSYGVGHVLGSASSSGSGLTEEQKERMERNRLLAAERRKARLAALQQNSIDGQSINKEATSQDISAHDVSLDTSFRNQENILSSSCNLFAKFNADSSLLVADGPLKVNNQNSENLKLDDLIDLVDEEESVSDKNAVTLSYKECKTLSSDKNKSEDFSFDEVAQVNSMNSERNVNDSVSDNVNIKKTISNVVEEDTEADNENSENLGLDDLIDLVDEEEFVSDENTIALSHEECKTASSDEDKNEDQVNSIHSEQNVNGAVRDNISSEMTVSGEISKTESKENLEIESMLDLVNENSGDVQLITDSHHMERNSCMNDTEKENVLMDFE